jgi:hypothetical protein
MNRFTIIGCVSIVALMVAGFGPWRPSTEPSAISSIEPFALMLSAQPMPVASGADTF